MANRTIAVIVTDADHDYLARMAGSNWSYVATVARRLLAERISELRDAEAQEESDSDN